MKKFLILLGGVAGLGVLVVVVLAFSLGSIVKAGVNRFGPPITKTKVELAGARISPLTGNGTISGLTIGNPPGWQSEKAIYLGQAHISMAPFSIFGDHIIVNEILVDQPEFVFETKIFSSNLQDLLKNIVASTGAGAGAVETAKSKSGQPIRFAVKLFRLQNGKVTISLGPSTTVVPLPPLTLTDLGTENGGITANQLAAIVMQRVLGQVVAIAADAYAHGGKATGNPTSDAVIDAAKKATDQLKNLLHGQK